jgi:methyltransferase (TIGR00027 family)
MNCTQQAHTPHEQGGITTGVGITALAVAAARAIETHRPDGLIHDPYAEAFVNAAEAPTPMPTHLPEPHETTSIPDPTGPSGEQQQLWATAARHMGMRSRFFDECLTNAAEAGIHQVVLLAAGLDTRAYRLDWPAGTSVFELDQPAVLEFKNHVLTAQGRQPTCQRHVVPVDLRDAWPLALTAAGFDPSAPSVWLAEGLWPYLPNPAQHELLDGITARSATGSRLALEYFCHPQALRDDPTLATLASTYGIDLPALLPAENTSSDPPEPEGGLHTRGWATQSHSATEIAAYYQRRSVPFSQRMNPDECRYLTASLPGQAGRN